MERRAEFIKINDQITMINDADESIYYLICGTKKALMVDTGNGYEDVMKIARELTDLPIEVVNTHGHCDHIYGNIFCQEAWMHPNDFPLCEQHFEYAQIKELGKGRGCCPLKPLHKEQIFDLGDVVLEVIEIFGHTPGSIGLLDRKHRILFSGDAINPFIWLQLEETLPLLECRKNIGAMMDTYGELFDHHLCGHVKYLMPKQQIYDLLVGIDEILAGDIKEDKDYEWFGGVDKYHLYADGNNRQICYSVKKFHQVSMEAVLEL